MPQKTKHNLTLTFIPISVISLVIATSIVTYYREKASAETNYGSISRDLLMHAKDNAETLLNHLTTDMHILTSHIEVSKYFEDFNAESKANLTEEFKALSSIRGVYAQLRLLDTVGQEVIRINRIENTSVVVSDELMQNKGDRYYFKDTYSLEKDEIFMSPLDLNIEQGQIEQPLSPMLRLGTPVYHKGEKMGVIVANYRARDLLESVVHTVTGTISEHTLEVLNQDGYWLYSSDKDKEWGFMYPEKEDITLAVENPALWEKIMETDKGQFYYEGDLYSFQTVYPFTSAQATSSGSMHANSPSLEQLNPQEYQWKLLSIIPGSIVYSSVYRWVKFLITFNLITVVMVYTYYNSSIKAIRDQLASKDRILKLNKILEITNKTLRHDLANIFTGIKRAYELYVDDNDDVLLAEGFGQAEQGIELIHQMRELELLGKEDAPLEKVSLAETLEVISHDYEIPINIEGSENVYADSALPSVFVNLFNNAVIHGGTKSIDIKIDEDFECINVHIIDHGKGIPDPVKKQIFEESFTYGSTGNTGLGLYIVEQTMARYGGYITVVDTKPTGVTFVLCFPLKKGNKLSNNVG